ncbi:MAG TPA: hypothetical protein VJR89_25255 [Polyangiales bacterium]|nr:hypothetical protein [Polyangiales bacterium]
MILVVAIPMAAVLVGCVWQIAGLSEALLYRESVEDAADSTAFHSAVLHARGMNAIASLNVVMGLLSAVTGLVRAVQVLGVLGADPALVEAADRRDAALHSRIEAALDVAAEAQAGIAAATPLMAAGSSAAASSSRSAAQRALAFSYAALPAAVDRALTVDGARPWLLVPSSDPRAPARLGPDSSLPVSRDVPDPVCSQAQAWSAAALQPLAPELVRDPALAARVRALSSQFRSALDAPLAGLLCGQPEPAQPAAARPQRPARVWPRAENGNVMLQIWASARAGAPLRQHGLELLARGTVRLEADRDAFAQAEYYFACPRGLRRWPECGEQALWSLGWRARPRRLWRPDAAAPALVGRAFERGLPALERALGHYGVQLDARARLAALLSHEAP